MASSTESWEGWQPSWAVDLEGPGAWGESGPDVEHDPDSLDTAAAAAELYESIVDLKLSGKVSATAACIIAYWAGRAGAAGPVKELGLKPGLQSGKYSLHFDQVTQMGVDSVGSYELPVVRKLKSDLGRRCDPLPMIPVHEALLGELAEDNTASAKFEKARSAGDLPYAYDSHPAVVESLATGRAPPLPYCLYLDGVSFARRDSVLGIWCHWLHSRKRHLLFVLRKSESCDCGCRSWCSLFPIWAALKWSMSALLTGKHPAARHDNSVWLASDVCRAAFSDKPMLRSGICIFLKGDWAEIVHTWGFPSWQANVAPCIYCHTARSAMFSIRGFSAVGMPSPKKSLAEYLASCEAVEHRRYLTADQIRLVRSHLGYTERKGYCLNVDLPALHLLKWDRFEPTLEFPNIASLDPAEGPRTAIFWRQSEAYITKRRNPLLSPEAGLSLDSFAIDWLHCVSLGVIPHACGHYLQELIGGNVFSLLGQVVLDQSCHHIRHYLDQWYKADGQAGRHHSKLAPLNKGMLERKGQPFLCAFGAECNGFLKFTHDVLLARWGPKLGARHADWKIMIETLLIVLDVCRMRKGKLQPNHIQRYCDAAALHMQAMARLQIPLRPKHHEMLELGCRLLYQHFRFN